MPVEPNCVYVIPPNRDLGIRDGVAVSWPSPGSPSTASACRSILSFGPGGRPPGAGGRASCFPGPGRDGTLGVRAIHGAGGLTIAAQDPQTAQYGDMPAAPSPPNWWTASCRPSGFPGGHHGLPPAALRPGRRAGGRPGGRGQARRLPRHPGHRAGPDGCDFRCYKKSTCPAAHRAPDGAARRLRTWPGTTSLLHRDAEEVRAQLVQGPADQRHGVLPGRRRRSESSGRQAARPLVRPGRRPVRSRVWAAGLLLGRGGVLPRHASQQGDPVQHP